MRRFAVLPLAVLLVTPALAAETTTPPHVVAEMFCMARVVGDMSLVTDYLSADLYAAIGEALARNDEIQKQFPDDKPPLGDGVPWATYQDAVPKCDVDYKAAEATPGAVPITYSYPDQPDVTWTDTLVLVEVDGTWQLDDILYQDGGRLTEVLVSAFEA